MKCLFIPAMLSLSCYARAQQPPDTVGAERFSLHAQTTVVNQYKPAYQAPYTGVNSLLPGKENQTSVTGTLFLGARLWKGAAIFLNPELAGGSGLSQALGVADAPNGETFRIGSAEPKIYLARLFLTQIIALGEASSWQESDQNQLRQRMPQRYLSLTIGKIGIADYFDNNRYSYDPRTQFMSWGLMSNGAWDYPANTRGYTPGIVAEYMVPRHELRYAFALLPKTANGPDMNWDISRAGAHSLEYVHHCSVGGHNGAIRILGFFNTSDMGSYRQSLSLNPMAPDITQTRRYGNAKYGFALNAEQALSKDLGCFFRGSWNDGRNETWAFTEIDRSISGGISLQGKRWHRPQDNVGIAAVASGISRPHRDYLAAGGKGFMLGDGMLRYRNEYLAECYYSAALTPQLFVSGGYQLILNPGYNKDRSGPVSVFSFRVHTSI